MLVVTNFNIYLLDRLGRRYYLRYVIVSKARVVTELYLASLFTFEIVDLIPYLSRTDREGVIRPELSSYLLVYSLLKAILTTLAGVPGAAEDLKEGALVTVGLSCWLLSTRLRSYGGGGTRERFRRLGYRSATTNGVYTTV